MAMPGRDSAACCRILTLCSVLLSTAPGLALAERAGAAEAAPMELEGKIALPDVHGRIDHLAVDVARQRLYVAELGNDTVGVVDLKDRKVLRTLRGFKEAQGIGYVPSTDTLYVANAGDGTVRVFQGADLTPIGQIALGDDADNVRVDDAAHRLFVGYGSGAIAVIDTASRAKIADVPLNAHPESFRLDHTGERIYVNVPDAHEIAVVDRAANKQVATWPTGSLRSNFPLAWDEPRQRVVVVFRHPATIGVFRAKDGMLVSSVATCGDSDDMFMDAKRDRLYVICGAGYLEVFSPHGETFQSIAQIPTVGGARTGLFVPELDRLFIAARATLTQPAAIWVFRPMQ